MIIPYTNYKQESAAISAEYSGRALALANQYDDLKSKEYKQKQKELHKEMARKYQQAFRRIPLWQVAINLLAPLLSSQEWQLVSFSIFERIFTILKLRTQKFLINQLTKLIKVYIPIIPGPRHNEFG